MPTTADVIAKYIAIRDFIEDRQKKFDEFLAPYYGSMKSIEAYVANELNTQNADSISTERGTAYRSTLMQTKVESREDWLDFVFDGRREGFITNAVPKDAVKEHLEANNSVPPPGIKVNFIHKVNFRRS